jgi:hypothetical protein
MRDPSYGAASTMQKMIDKRLRREGGEVGGRPDD